MPQKSPETLTHPRSDAYFGVVKAGVLGVMKIHVLGSREGMTEKPEIITPNHLSVREVAVQGVAVEIVKNKPATFVAAQRVMQEPFGTLFRPLGACAVPKDKDSRMQVLTSYAETARDDGRSTVIYPEGGWREGEKTDFEIARPVRPGALAIASALDMDIRPSGVVMRSFKENLVFYGEAFSPEEVGVEELADRMQEALDVAAFEADKVFGRA